MDNHERWNSLVGENRIKIPFAHSLGLKGEGKHSCGFRRGGWRSTVRRRAFAVEIGGGLEKKEKDLGQKVARRIFSPDL